MYPGFADHGHAANLCCSQGAFGHMGLDITSNSRKGKKLAELQQ